MPKKTSKKLYFCTVKKAVSNSPPSIELVVEYTYDNDDDKNPKDHIKIKAVVTTIISLTAFSHCRLLLSMFCNIYYDGYVKFADCPHVLLEFFIEIG